MRVRTSITYSLFLIVSGFFFLSVAQPAHAEIVTMYTQPNDSGEMVSQQATFQNTWITSENLSNLVLGKDSLSITFKMKDPNASNAYGQPAGVALGTCPTCQDLQRYLFTVADRTLLSDGAFHTFTVQTGTTTLGTADGETPIYITFFGLSQYHNSTHLKSNVAGTIPYLIIEGTPPPLVVIPEAPPGSVTIYTQSDNTSVMTSPQATFQNAHIDSASLGNLNLGRNKLYVIFTMKDPNASNVYHQPEGVAMGTCFGCRDLQTYRFTDADRILLSDQAFHTFMVETGTTTSTYADGTRPVFISFFNLSQYQYGTKIKSNAAATIPYLIIKTPPPPDPCAAPDACASNVLFLPGVEASRLYRPDYAGGIDSLWEPYGDADGADITLNPDGTVVREDVYTKDVIGTAYVPLKGDIYKSFIDSMNTMKSGGIINDWEAAPYDWRLSLDAILDNGKQFPDGRLYYSGPLAATSTPYVIQELRRLAATSKTGKVTIVAHSNGGLVAKRLTELLGPDASTLIDKIIFVAVPQVGTPQAVGAILHGYDQALPISWFPAALSDNEARTIATNMPSAYNLLPSHNYFTQVDDPVITIDHDPLLAPWRARYGDTIHSKELLHAFLTDQSREVLPTDDALKSPIIANETLLNKAENVHGTQLDNWTPPAGIELTEIAGWGEDTLKTIIYYQGTRSACTSYRTDSTCTAVVRTPVLEYKAKTVLDGDGTVVVPSALWTPGAARYWVDLLGYGSTGFRGSTIDRKHADILEVPQLRAFIQNLITGSTTASFPQFISTSTPPNPHPDKQLHFTLHSPLSLDMYDDLGNHTGISTTTGFLEENIPDSRYETFGELKYISVPSSAHTRLFMHGYATGSFTLDVDEVQGDTAIASTTFAAIPSSTGTVASLDIPGNAGVANLTPLTVDENGDGATDITLVPKTGGVVFPDFTPPATSATTTGTLGTNGWYTGNVMLTLNATDTESGVAQTFSSVDGGATTTATTALITAEGVHTVSYYSTDNAGNQEQATTTTFKLDKTPPEASIVVSTSTKDLLITGLDNLSPATVSKTATTTSIVDEAGNTTKLVFQKTYVGALLTYARLLSIQYGTSTPLALPSSLLYVWNPLTNPATLVSQTIAVDNVYAIQALYDKVKNKTTIIVLKKNSPIQTKVFSGLEIVKLTTNKGVVGYTL